MIPIPTRPTRYIAARDLPAAFLIPLWSSNAARPATAIRVAYGSRVLVRFMGHAVILGGDARVLVAERAR